MPKIYLPQYDVTINAPDDKPLDQIQAEIEAKKPEIEAYASQRMGVSPEQFQQAQGAAFGQQKIPLAEGPDYNLPARIARTPVVGPLVTEPAKALERGFRETAASIGGAGVEAAGGAFATMTQGLRDIGLEQPLGAPIPNPLEGQSEIAKRRFGVDLPRLQPSQRMQDTTYTGALTEMATGEGPSGGRGQAAVDFGTKLVSDTLGIAPSMAATVAGFLMAGPAGAGAMGGFLEGASQYEKAKAEGKSEQKALQELTTVGVGTGVLNAIPFIKAFDKVLPDQLKGYAANFLLRGAVEGATETAEGALPPLAELERAPRTTKEATDLLVNMGAGIYDESGVFLPAALTGGIMGGAATAPRRPAAPPTTQAQPQPLQIEYQRKLGLDDPSRYPAIPIEPTSGPPIPLGRPQPQQTAYAPDIAPSIGIQGMSAPDIKPRTPRPVSEGVMQGGGAMIEVPEVLNYPQFGYGNVIPIVPTYAPNVAPASGVMGFGVGESSPRPIPEPTPGPQDTSGAGPYGIPNIPQSPMETLPPVRQTPKKLQRFETLFDEAAAQTGVQPDILMAIAQVESGGNPKAVSPKGAKGIMQIIDATAQELGIQDATDPKQAIPAAARYLARGLERHNGNLDLALADYNAGPGNVDKYGGVPPFKETQEYIRKVRSAMAAIQGDTVTASLLRTPPDKLQQIVDTRVNKGKPVTAKEVKEIIGEGDKESVKPVRDWVNQQVEALPPVEEVAPLPELPAAAAPVAQPASSRLFKPADTFEEFEKQYRQAFDDMKRYTPNQVGAQYYADRMSKLYEAHPEWADAIENRPESRGPYKAGSQELQDELNYRNYRDNDLRRRGYESEARMKARGIDPILGPEKQEGGESYGMRQEAQGRQGEVTPAQQAGGVQVPPPAKQPWEMTRKEFEGAFLFHSSHVPDTIRREGLKGGSMFTTDPNDTAFYGKKGEPFFVVRSEDIKDVPAEDYDIIGAEIMKTGQYRRSGSHITPVAEVPSAFRSNPHRYLIREALSQGKPVPAEVLADYPDLAAKYYQPPSARQQALSTAAQNLAAIEGKAEPVVSEGQAKAFDRLVSSGIPSEPRPTAAINTLKFGAQFQNQPNGPVHTFGAIIDKGKSVRYLDARGSEVVAPSTRLVYPVESTSQQETPNAIEARQQQQNRQPERIQIGQGGPTAEAGGGNRAVQGGQEQRQVEPLTFRRVKVGNKNAYDTTVSGRTVTIDRTAAEPGLPFEVRVEGQSAPVDFFRTLGEAKDYISNTLRQEMESEAQGDVEPAQPVVKQELTTEPKQPWEMTREEFETAKLPESSRDAPSVLSAPLFHGTDANFSATQFQMGMKGTNDLGLLGQVETERAGIFLSDNKDFASEFGKNVIPVRAIMESVADVDETKQGFIDSLPLNNDLRRRAYYSNQPWGMFEGGLGKAYVEYLKQEGYDSAFFNEETTKADGGYIEGGTFVVFDPKQVLPNEHKAVVDQAIASGKPVPPAVLAEYPDLAAKYAQPTPKESSVTATRPEPSANIPNYDGPISKQYSIEATRKNAKPMLDPKGKPTGWRAIQAENGTILIHPTENRTVAFVHEGDQSKASLIRRKRMLAQAFAMDNPIEAKVSPAPETQGELVTKPVFQPSGETGQLATPRPIWKQPFKQYAKERMASENLTDPREIADREQELRRVHRRAVQDAIAAGKKVPVANVKEYGGGEAVATPAKVEGQPKQPWEMTREEFERERPAVEGYLYHGSPDGDISQLDPYFHTKPWEEGQGPYATTDRNIAAGYARGRTAKGERKISAEDKGRVNYIKSEAVNILNLDAPYAPDTWSGIFSELGINASDFDNAPSTNYEAMQEARSLLSEEMGSRTDAYYALEDAIRNQGFDATTHTEGKSGTPHLVTVFKGDIGVNKDGSPFDTLKGKVVSPETVHREAIESALREGKPVPASVLADYPDLAAKASAPAKPAPAAGKGEVAAAPTKVSSSAPAQAYSMTYTAPDGNRVAVHFSKARFNDLPEELQQDVRDALSRANSYGDSKEAKELNDFIEGKTVRFLQRNERNNETPQYTIYDTEGEFRQAFARFATDTSGRFHDRLLSDSSKRLAAEIIAERDAAQNEAQAKSQMEQQERQLKERQFQEIVAEIDEIPMPKGERVSFRPAGTFEDVSGIKYGAWILHKSPVKGKTKLSHYQSGLGMSPRTPLSTPEAKRFIKGTLKANADVDFIDNASGKEKVKALGEIYNFLFRGGDAPASLTTSSTPANSAPAASQQPTTPTSATILSDLRDQAREEGLNPIEQKKRNDRLRQAFDEQYPGSGGKAFSEFMRTGNPPKKPKRGSDPTNPQAGVINLDAPKAAWDAFSDFIFRQTVGPFTKSRPMGVAEAEAFRIARRAQEGVANRGNLQKENALITFKRALRQRVGGESFTRTEKQLVSRASDLSRKDKRIRTALAPKNATKADVMQSVRDVLDGKSKVLLLPEKVYNASEGMRDLLAAGSDFLVENGIALSEGLITAIKDNVGFWLRRSYRVHKDPNWVKAVQGRPEWNAALDAMEKEWREFVDTPEKQTDLELIQFGRRHLPGVKNAKALNEIEAALKDDPNNETLGPEARAKVEEALRALGKPDRDQLEIRLTEMLQEMSNEGRENFANRRLGSQNRSSFMRRNEIPKWLRDVMGEYHDTEINFALSSEAMTQMISAWTFSQKMYELGYNKFIFNTREEIPASLKGSYYTKVPDNPKYGMLAGKYTSQEMKDAIDQKIAEAGTIGKLFNTLSGTIRWLLTIGNVATGGGIRNFVTSGIGAMLRGDIPIATGTKFFRVLNKERAIMPALAKSLNMEYTSELGMLKALAQHHLEMVERGVHDSDPNFNLAKDRLKDSFLNDLLTGKLGEESYLDVPREKVLALKRKMENLWLFGDNFWKSVSHAETMNRWSPYAKKQRWSEQRLRDYIDGAIRGVTPTYAETYEIINRMKRTGTGAVYQDFITWSAERFRNKVNLVRLIRDELATGDKTLMASAAMRIATLAGGHLAFTALLPVIGKWALGSDSDDEDWAVRQFVPAWMNNSAIAYLGDRGEDGNYRIADLSYSDPDAWMNKMIFSAFQGDWDEVPKTFAETFFGVAIAAELTAELMTNTKGNQQPIWLSTDSLTDWVAKVGRHVIFRAGGTPAKLAVHAYEKANGKQEEIGARSLQDQLKSATGASVYTVNPKENTRHYALKTAAQFRAISKQITDSMTKYPNQDEKALREKYGNQRNKSAEELVRIGVAGRETGLTQNQIRQIFKDASIRQDYIAKIMMAIERSYNDMKKTGVRDFSVQLPTGDKAKGGGGLLQPMKPMQPMRPLTIPGL